MGTKKVALFAAALVAGVCGFASLSYSDDAKKDGGHAMAGGGGDHGSMDMAKMMEECEARQKPNEHHAMMKMMEGTYDATTKMRMTANDSWMESKGTTTNKLIFDGRYLMSDFKGEMMGKPFTGHGLLGHNNLSGKHESMWFDSMSTGIMKAEGTCSDGCKTMTFNATMDNPMEPGKKMDVRYEYRVKDANTHEFHWFEKGMDGKEFESMVITYTKAK